MDTFIGYSTPKWQHTSRHAPDKFIKTLNNFYEKHTNTKLESLTLTYRPSRLSDPQEYEHWLDLRNSSIKPCPQETDEDVNKNLEFIQQLDIISESHRDKIPGFYEEHEYQIKISSFDKLFNLLKIKNNYSSLFSIAVENKFDFNNYDYSEMVKKLSWTNNGANRIWMFICSGVESDYQLNKKIATSVKLTLFFPQYTENELTFLRSMQDDLKIKFSSNGFSKYYITDKGKMKSKKEKIIL